ncbi:protein of unknown function [Tenacibaculum sp. 190524A05c]
MVLFFVITKSMSQNYFQSTSNPFNSFQTLHHKGSIIIGDQQTPSSLNPFQIYSNSPTKSMGMVLGNASGRWGFNIAGANGAFHPKAIPGTGVIWKLGLSHNMIFSMPNTNMTNPAYDTTNWNSSGVTSIRFADLVNHDSFVIYNTGKITVGTPKYDNDNNYRLYVKDGIKTERIKVEIANTNGWADYVFNENYHLIPLDKLNSFIKENKHLPEIPSAKEVVTDGVELKNMSVLLLKKIEELTLYTIQQQELINEMKEEIKELKKKN